MKERIDEAIAEIEQGNRKRGLSLLLAIIQIDPKNEEAWLCLGTFSSSPEKKEQCLNEVLRINPNNREAKRALASLKLLTEYTPVTGPSQDGADPLPTHEEMVGVTVQAISAEGPPEVGSVGSAPRDSSPDTTVAAIKESNKEQDRGDAESWVLDATERQAAAKTTHASSVPEVNVNPKKTKRSTRRWGQPFRDEAEAITRFPSYVDELTVIMDELKLAFPRENSDLRFAKKRYDEAVDQGLPVATFLSPAVQAALTVAESLEGSQKYAEAFWIANVFGELCKILVGRNRQKFQPVMTRLLLVAFCSAAEVHAENNSPVTLGQEGDISAVKSHLEQIARFALGTYFNGRQCKFVRDWQPDQALAERLISEALARHCDRQLRHLIQDDRPRVREYVTQNIPIIYRLKLDDRWDATIDEWEMLLIRAGYDDLIHNLKSTGVLIRVDKVGQLSDERLDDVRRAASNNDLNRVRDLLKDSSDELKAYLYAEAQTRLDYRQPPQPHLGDRFSGDLFGKARRLADRGDGENFRDALGIVQGLWEKDIANLELRDWVAYLHAKNNNPKAAEPILEQIRKRRDEKNNFITTWNLAVLAYDRKDEAGAYDLLTPLLSDARPDDSLVLVVMALALKLNDHERFLSLIPQTLSLRFHPLGVVVAHDRGDRLREGEFITQMLRRSEAWELPPIGERFASVDDFFQVVNKAIVEGQVDQLIPWLEARVKLQRGWVFNYLALARVLEEEKQDNDGAFRVLSERLRQLKTRPRDQQRLDEAHRELFELSRRSNRKDLGQQVYGLAEANKVSDDLLRSFAAYSPVPTEGPSSKPSEEEETSTEISRQPAGPNKPTPRDPRLAERLAWVTARLASIRNVATYAQEAPAVEEFCSIIIEMSPQEGGTLVKIIRDASEVIDIFHRTDAEDHDTRRVLYDRSVGYDNRLSDLAMSGALPRSLSDVLTPYHVALKKVVGDLSRQAGIGPNIEASVENQFFSFEPERSTLIVRVANVSERPAADVTIELLLDSPTLAVIGKRERRIPALDSRKSALLSFPVERNVSTGGDDEREVRCGISLRASAEGFPNVDLGIAKRSVSVRPMRDAIGFDDVPKLFQSGNPLKPSEPELFQGRGEIIKKISGSFFGGVQRERFFLDGIRRVGKTSILNFLPLSLPDKMFPVSVNLDKFGLRGPTSSASILSQFCSLIKDSGMSQSGIEVEVPPQDMFEANPSQAFSRFIADLKAALPERVPFIMVDEFQELLYAVARSGRANDRDTLVLDQIRGHSDEGNIYMVFTGSVRFDRLSTILDHRIFGSLTRLRVSFLSEASVGDVMRAGFGQWVKIPSETIRRLFELTGGYPWLVQTYGAGLVDVLNRERRTVVSPDDVDYVTREAVLCNDELFSHWWPIDQLGIDEERFVEWLFRNYPGGGPVVTRDLFASIHNRELPSFRRAFDNLRACEVLDSTQTEVLRFSGNVLRQWLEQKMRDGQLKLRAVSRGESDKGQGGIFVDHENLVKSAERISRSRGIDWRSDKLSWFTRILNSIMSEAERRCGPLKYRVTVAFWERPQESLLLPAYFKHGFQIAAPEPVKLSNAVDFKVASEVRRANEQALREGTRLGRAVVVTGDGDLSHETRALVNDGVVVQIWGGSRETNEVYRGIVGEDNVVVLDDVSGL
jgi:hypothetical protein